MKPSATPVTMFCTSVRDMPHIARARFSSSRGVTVTLPSSSLTSTSGGSVDVSSPSLPLAVTVWPSTATVTPAGTGTGCLPIRDMRQNTVQRTSPPTLAARASASDMTPRGVDRMAMPRPL